MFDFFKDAYAELNGLDIEAIKEERKEKRKKKYIYISPITKVIIAIVGVLYFAIAGVEISLMIKTGFTIRIIKIAILVLLDIAILSLMFFKKKQTEIAAIICIVFFIAINFMTTNL